MSAADGTTPTTLAQALLAAPRDGSMRFHLDDGMVAFAQHELAERALAAAARLSELGVNPGDRVGVLGPNQPEWAWWAGAIWCAGAVVVPLGFPLRVRDPQAFAEQVKSLTTSASCRLVVADPALLPSLPRGLGLAWDDVARGAVGSVVDVAPESPAVIQFTSGSTAAPKGSVLSHAAVLAQMRDMFSSLRFWPGQAVVGSWVPFFHDLGLFNYVVAPLLLGYDADILPTERFARDPTEWFRMIAKSGVTITTAPPSSWAAALRLARHRPDGIDLSSLAYACLSTEGIEPRTADEMADAGAALGLDPMAIATAYGLGEMTLAVTVSDPGSGVAFDFIDMRELASSGRATPSVGSGTKRIASSGRAIRNAEVRISAPDGPAPEREVGEILVRGPSMMSGYLSADAEDPFVDGWLRTGDLGYLADGELYVTGRIKDVVITHGQNYYPEDFEWAAGRVEGVRTGRCVAFKDPAAESVVMLIELTEGTNEDKVRAQVRSTLINVIGPVPVDVVVVPRDTIEKTTSGKLRRSATRERFLAS